MLIEGVEVETKSRGNLFAVNDIEYDGMAVFVMCGLTGFRPQSYDFIERRCRDAGKAKGRMRLYNRDDGVLVAYDRNRDNHIYVGSESYELLDAALTLLSESGATRIIMNGIRSRGAPNPRTTDANEEDTLRSLIRWITSHPESGIKKIVCVSGGCEFERALGRIQSGSSTKQNDGVFTQGELWT